jgi:hypothetical protein
MQSGGVGFYPTGITPWVHIDSGSVRYWPRMSRDALTRLFPDGKTVFIPADGQPMPGYEQARAEIEARGGQVQVTGGGFFSWLFGARGGGADDAEEEGGQEATIGMARGGRGGAGGGAPAEPQVQVADAGPEAVARAKRSLPTGPAYASPAEPAPAAKPQGLEAGPDAVAKAKRNLPTGPAYASAAEPAPAPPVKVVATLEQPDVASDASPTDAHGTFGAKSFGPLPPRRPADLDIAAALAGAPMPPTRPAELILASAPDQGGGAVFPPAPDRAPGAGGVIAPYGLLPQIITSGVDKAPTGALALAEAPLAQTYDDSALLAKAAELTAPLPPMPIRNVGAPATTAAPARPQTDADGGVLHSAALAAEDLARLFGGLPFDAFKTAAPAPAGELRGAQ